MWFETNMRKMTILFQLMQNIIVYCLTTRGKYYVKIYTDSLILDTQLQGWIFYLLCFCIKFQAKLSRNSEE